MLSVQKMTQSAEECMGWPYVSPGSNDSNGIDCSGLFVKIFRDQGAKIAHGSNSIFYEYCYDTQPLTSESQLIPGMAVFKWKQWTDSDKDNRWYGKQPGNLSHIGYVASINPLKIIHASSVSGCVTTDTKITNWKYCGKLKDVDYSEGGSPDNPSPDPEPSKYKLMSVVSDNGKAVKLRQRPSTSCGMYDMIEPGTIVEAEDYNDIWYKVNYGKRIGWFMMKMFLEESTDPTPTPEPEPTPTPTPDPEPTPVPSEPVTATVKAASGTSVKMRRKPSKKCGQYDDVPVGATVYVEQKGTDWTKIDYGIRKGWYMMTQFLEFNDKN